MLSVMSYTVSPSPHFVKIFSLTNAHVAQEASRLLAFFSQSVNQKGVFDFQKAQQMVAQRPDLRAVKVVNHKIDGLTQVFPLVVKNYPLVQDPELFHYDFNYFTEANFQKIMAHQPPAVRNNREWYQMNYNAFQQAAYNLHHAQQYANASYAQNPQAWEPMLLLFLIQQIFKGNTANYTVKNFFYEMAREAIHTVCRTVNHEIDAIVNPILDFVHHSFSNIEAPSHSDHFFFSKSSRSKSSYSYINNMIAFEQGKLYCLPFTLQGVVDFEDEEVLGFNSSSHAEMSITVQGLLVEKSS